MSSKNRPLVASIRHWLTRFYPNPSPDADLIRQFAHARDESAFAALLDRHGPMVLGVARRVVGDHNTAEDVFQATFLVLAREAGRLRSPSGLPAWLHRTAHNIALSALRDRKRRDRADAAARPPATGSPLDDLSSRELLTILDEELHRLPEALRLPLILCCLEGRSQDEAARLLGWTPGSVKGRLERGRQRLKDRLIRRGISFAIGVGVPLLIAPPTIAGIREATLQAVQAGASASAAVAALVKATLNPVITALWKSVLVIAAVILAAGGAAWTLWPGSRAIHGKSVAMPPIAVAQEQAPLPRLDFLPEHIPQEPAARLGTARFRHEAAADDLAFTPDGKTLVGCTSSGVYLWDAATGKELRRLPALPFMLPSPFSISRPTNAMGISADGTTLAMIENGDRLFDVQIGLWNLASGKKMRVLSFPKEKDAKKGSDAVVPRTPAPVGTTRNHLFFSSDGKSLVSLADIRFELGKAAVFDLASGQVRLSLGGGAARFYNYAVSSDGKMLAAAVKPEHSVQLFDVATGKLLHVIHELPADQGSASHVWAIAFSRDSKMLAFSGAGRVFLFDPATGKEIHKLGPTMSVLDLKGGLAFTPDGKKLVFGGSFRYSVMEVATGKILHIFENSPQVNGSFAKGANPGSMALSPDGKTFALGDRGRTVQLWDVDTGKELFADNQGHEAQITSLAFSPDAKTAVSADDDLQVFLWDTASGQRTGILPRSARALSFSPDGEQVAIIAVNKDESATRVRFWDVAAGKERLVITVDDAQVVRSATFSPDGRKLFTLDWNKNRQSQYYVRHWDVATGKQDREWAMPYRDAAKEKPSLQRSPLKTIAQPTLLVFLAPDGRTVFAARDNKSVGVYDVESGRQRLLTGNETQKDWELSFAPSPDARVLASWMEAPLWSGKGPGSIIRLTEAVTGQEIFRLQGHDGAVAKVAWSPDGRFVASGDRRSKLRELTEDQTVRLWDAATGKEVARFGGFKADVTALSFAPDGTSLGAGLGDGSILIWDVSKADPKLAPAPKLGKQELESCWTDLAGDNAARAHQAIWTLVAVSRDSMPFLRKRLRPAVVVDAGKIRQWIIDQDNTTLAVRQAAAKELENAGAQVETYIQKAMKDNTSLEARLRLDQILKNLEVPGPTALGTVRAIMALERIGSPEAKSVLEDLARGAPGARETEEARASLERLGQRSGPTN